MPRAYAFRNIQSRAHRGMERREEEEEDMTRTSGMQGRPSSSLLLRAGGAARKPRSLPLSTHFVTWRGEMFSVNAIKD